MTENSTCEQVSQLKVQENIHSFTINSKLW